VEASALPGLTDAQALCVDEADQNLAKPPLCRTRSERVPGPIHDDLLDELAYAGSPQRRLRVPL
jgi:hypothetical protein